MLVVDCKLLLQVNCCRYCLKYNLHKTLLIFMDCDGCMSRNVFYDYSLKLNSLRCIFCLCNSRLL